MIIQAPPLPPLTEGAFLRAGWEPQSVNGLVPDLSGFGKNGTLATVKPAFEVDPYFGPTMRTYANEAGYTFPCTLSVTTVGTWGVWYKVPSLASAGGANILMRGGAATEYFSLNTAGSLNPSFFITLNGVARSVGGAAAGPSIVGVPMYVVVTYDADKLRIYTDGTLRQTSASYAGPITNWNAGTGYVGTYSVANFSFDGNLRAPFVLNRAWSDAEVAQYYNTVAKVACWKSEYGYLVDLADQGGTVGAYL